VATPNSNQIMLPEDESAAHRILRSVKLYHLIVIPCVLFVAWGSGMQQVAGVDLTKLFSVLSVGVIAYWLLVPGRKFGVFPRQFNWFMLFVLFQSSFIYIFFVPEGLTFGYSYEGESASGLQVFSESNGIGLARFALYALFAYALASLLRNRRDLLVPVCLAYGIGLALTVVLGSNIDVSGGGDVARSTGGFQNANSLGSVARVAVFLNIFVLSYRRAPAWARALAAFLMIPTVYGLLTSVSRSAIISTCVGVMVMVWYQPMQKKVRWLVCLALLAVVGVSLLPAESQSGLVARFSDTQGNVDRVRLPIFTDYLRQWPHYVLQGVGLNRATSVTEATYTTPRLWIPHQTYLELLVEFGFVGLLLFVAAMWQLGRRIWVARLRQGRWGTDPAMLGLLVSWACFFAMGSYGTREFWLSWAVLAAYGSWKCE
jgi:O-antigen ligase